VFTIQYTDDDGEVLPNGGSVTAGDIASAQLDTGFKFAGFHVVTGSKDDVTDASSLTNRPVWVESNAGNDTTKGGGQKDKLDGGDGNDNIVGGAGADTITGGNGVDTLSGGSGADSVVGGQGTDIITSDGVDAFL